MGQRVYEFRILYQAAIFQRQGISIANELIDEQDESCGIMRALDGTVPAWNENYNPGPESTDLTAVTAR